jgi:putative membrane protein
MDKKNINKKNIYDWFIRFLKGMIIGMSFILPGISGGALAVILGLYEKMIHFIANMRQRLIPDFLFFLPVGIGGAFGIIALSYPLKFLLEHYEAQVMWLFVGAILGTMPLLWKKAGKKGRKTSHLVIVSATLILGFLSLYFARYFIGEVPQNIVSWFLIGVWIAFSSLIPGLPTSNFLILFGVYEPMLEAIGRFHFIVLIPLFLGVLISVFPLSKGVAFLIEKKYAGFFHFVVGIVAASTLLIIPLDYDYLGNTVGTIACIVLFLGGVVFAYQLSKLSKDHE